MIALLKIKKTVQKYKNKKYFKKLLTLIGDRDIIEKIIS